MLLFKTSKNDSKQWGSYQLEMWPLHQPHLRLLWWYNYKKGTMYTTVISWGPILDGQHTDIAEMLAQQHPELKWERRRACEVRVPPAHAIPEAWHSQQQDNRLATTVSCSTSFITAMLLRDVQDSPCFLGTYGNSTSSYGTISHIPPAIAHAFMVLSWCISWTGLGL